MSPKSNKVRFGNVVLCEDVREEKRRKHTLVGVFGGDIFVENLPAKIQLAFYIELHNITKGNVLNLEAKIGATKLKLESTIDEDLPDASIILQRRIFSFESEGSITIRASVNNGRPKTILSKTVRKGVID